MWVAKISIPSKDGMLLAPLAKKHRVSISGYPLTHFFEKDKFNLLISANLIGDERAKKEFLADLKKDTRAKKIDMMNDHFGIWLIEQHPSLRILYDSLIIHVKPSTISEEGVISWELASWKKEKLLAIAQLARSKLYGGKLVSMTQRKINTIAITSVLPDLTKKQRRAIELAVSNGYYGYPRKIDLGSLAKLMGVSYSTYQFHLRVAEKKMMPYLFSR